MSYYLREGLYQHAADEASEQIRRRGKDTSLLYWKAFALGMEGLVPEAIREMEGLRSKHEVELAVAMALLYFHGKAKMVDREAVETISVTLSITEDTASDGGVITAARFQWLIGDLDYARKLVTKVQRGEHSAQTPIQQQAFALRGWIDASIRQPRSKEEVCFLQESISFFEGSEQERDLDTIMGKACYYGSRSDGAEAAVDHLSHAIALAPRFWPALVERARLWAAVGDWEQAEDALSRVLDMDDANVPALMLHALQGLTQAGQVVGEGIDRLRRLSESLSKREPRNARFHLRASKPFARVCGRDPVVLQLTIGMLESVKNNDADLLIELGYQLSLSGAFDSAKEAYQAGARFNQGDVRAMTGVIYCEIQEGDLEDAAQQLEFLNVMQESIGISPDMCLVRAMLKFRFERSMDQHLAYLDQGAELHESSGNIGGGQVASDPLERLCVLNPDLMLEIAKEYLLHAGSEAEGGSDLPLVSVSTDTWGSSTSSAWTLGQGHGSSPVSKGLAMMRDVVRLVPGHTAARLAMARAFYSIGQSDLAHQTLQAILSMDPAHQEAHLLAAQVFLSQGKHRAASSSLEQALSFNFRVGKNPIFLLVKGSVLKEEGKLQEALETFEEALRLPCVREATRVGSTSTSISSGMALSSLSSSSTTSLTDSDKAAIFVGAITSLAKLKRTEDANELAREAAALFRGTPDEVHIVVANSELAIERGDVDKALKILGRVPQASPAYVRVQTSKARIYLSLRRDKRAFAQCYRDMAQSNPCAATYVRLGEAYMRIQMPEAAIESFEIALDTDPSDSTLAGQIGRALVSTHDYRRAVDYYQKALSGQPTSVPLKHDLARLCLKLGRFEDASGILREAMVEDPTDREAAESDVQTLLIAAEVHEASGADNDAESSLKRAHELQKTVLARSRSDSADAVRQAKSLLSKIIRERARFSLEVQKDDERALELYSATLRENEADEEGMIGLARTHLKRNELEQCEKLCQDVLRVSNDVIFDDVSDSSDGRAQEASMILAEVMFLKKEHDKAIRCYRDVLRRKPNNYKALEKLIGLLRRAGQLNEVPALLDLAKTNNPRSSAHAGLRYCSGLYYRFTNDVHEAIRQLNLARRDGEWGRRALEHLIEIYLSPNGDHLWEVATGAPGGDAYAEALGVARDLLPELKRFGREEGKDIEGGERAVATEAAMKRRYLKNAVKMMGRDKKGVAEAMEGYISMLEEDRENVRALLGMSLAFTLEGSPNKARNALKRIAKMPYTMEMAEEFEQAYLHLAHLYVDRGKFDLAQDLCRRCLSYNKSCSQAWESLGLIMEKEQSYRDAAECYEKSWNFGNQAGAAAGFKLAFNYLKAKRFVEAIDVCGKVLAQYPHYPKIREEILSKAQASLRP